jgi:hypothetical protein
MVSRQVFARHFWDCYKSLEAAVTDDVGMPGYFRFLTLLGEAPETLAAPPWLVCAVQAPDKMPHSLHTGWFVCIIASRLTACNTLCQPMAMCYCC